MEETTITFDCVGLLKAMDPDRSEGEDIQDFLAAAVTDRPRPVQESEQGRLSRVLMRADARKNDDHLLAVAREVIGKQGADASLRDLARKAGVELGTPYRHFPTREAVLAALLRASFDELTARADELETSNLPQDALLSWLREAVAVAHNYSGVVAAMVAAIADPDSPLHTSCVRMRAAGARLLARAQDQGAARNDIDGADLFALVGALAWLGDQPALAPRADHLFDIIASAILRRTSCAT